MRTLWRLDHLSLCVYVCDACLPVCLVCCTSQNMRINDNDVVDGNGDDDGDDYAGDEKDTTERDGKSLEVKNGWFS